jgi:carbamoyl-phosphate synthase large subunit
MPSRHVILTEGVGSPAWATFLPFFRAAAARVVALDIDPQAAGLYLADTGLLVPRYADPDCFEALARICRDHRVTLAFPSIHEGLLGWSERREEFARNGTFVAISPPETIAICEDKWRTYEFFRSCNVPTPRTSLRAEHELLKPRVGRGGAGIRRLAPGEAPAMDGHVTQEFLRGQEYSVDAFCDLSGTPLYIVPRPRLAVESGLSVRGKVVRHPEIESLARRALAATPFTGPVNLQCFDTPDGVFFTEINPRIAGGMSLSMAATENWFAALARLLAGETVTPGPVAHGLTMMRHYTDCFRPEGELLT